MGIFTMRMPRKERESLLVIPLPPKGEGNNSNEMIISYTFSIPPPLSLSPFFINRFL